MWSRRVLTRQVVEEVYIVMLLCGWLVVTTHEEVMGCSCGVYGRADVG